MTDFFTVIQAARFEHKTRFLTRLCQSPYNGCYFLGTLIILLNICRSHCFTTAMKTQPKLDILDCITVYYMGLIILVAGTVFVVCSFYALGFVGTFLGDYFGILMDTKVTGFPFNVMDNPMYWGSTANHFGWALLNASPVGLILTAVVALTYKVAIMFEGPFTEEIYQEKEKLEKNK
ncbi:phosphatidylethanolamine N-methyltransferase [Protopterus annectens]|uniref:phosphatidylethanolamine N-methyltransferase n=1 Tax=Protopterus annectens TaxID=7888 RepID=UPI001CF9BF91|nr:phosphatidylethanolamine N-methyltransferase [Protopterus annectens]